MVINLINPHKISWNGYTNIDYDTRTCLSFDSDNGSTNAFLGREAVVSESYNGARKIPHSYKWSEVLSPTITFIKEDFKDFNLEETRKFLKWITGNPGTGVLSIYSDESEAPEYEMIGNFINVEQYKLANGRCVGFVVHFESIQPFALSPIRTITKTVDNPAEFIINVETDEPKSAIYPKVTITEGSSFVVKADESLGKQFQINSSNIPYDYVPGTVYAYNNKWWYVDDSGVMHGEAVKPEWSTTSVVMQNLTTKTETRVGMNVPGEIITLDGANRIVSSSLSTNRVFGNNFNWQWLPLVEGENKIKVIGNCTITIEYREIIKVGDLV
jgi:hypothetical protein